MKFEFKDYADLLVKREINNDALFSMGNGKFCIAQLAYSKINTEGFPKYFEFDTVEQAA